MIQMNVHSNLNPARWIYRQWINATNIWKIVYICVDK